MKITIYSWSARRWGLSSAAHFSRIFRTTYGLSPKDYRNQAGRVPDTAGFGSDNSRWSV
jgi:AraC-like DNA-binding protein